MENKIKTPIRGLAGYQAVSRTFTYGITLAAFPLLIAYEIGFPILNEGRNGIEVILQKIATLFGILPDELGIPLLLIALVSGSLLAIRHEARKYGAIDIQPSFFFMTLNEAVLLSFVVFMSVYLLCYGNLILPFQHGIPPFGEILLKFTRGAGGGFFEELVMRVILLGGLVRIFQHFTKHELASKIFAVVIIALLFSAVHYVHVFGLVPRNPFTPQGFSALFLLGIAYGTIYLKRGFATAAWTHTFVNLWILINVFA
ncbi:MAG: CPBP family intramembrane glutamic endopeptidase [Candidatus Paceibacterota bacterium]|nr:CPBP family glutamic-type intramembrane protease [Candidatus Paceibacterota bacterium]